MIKTAERKIKMFKLALNAGHGFNTPGKRCLRAIDPNETKEYILNKRICDKIEKGLKEYGGIEVLRIDDGTEMAISTRAAKANAFKADFYLAIHHNAGIAGGAGGGIEAYVYLKTNDITKVWQSELYNSLVAETGLRGNRSQPLRSADLGECRETAMPAVLLECGFMDSTADTPIILTEEFAQKAADACVKAIAARAGAVAVKQPTAQTDTKPETASKSVEVIAREVIAGKWGNGAERKTRLAEAGYDAAKVQSAVNALLAGQTAEKKPLKTSEQIAAEVIAGKWGNGTERKTRLAEAGYNAAEIQKIVNAKLK